MDYNKIKKLTIWNIVLTILMISSFYLFFSLRKESEDLFHHNIAQDVVLCGYIEDIQNQTNINKKISPDCIGDIKYISNVNND